MLGMMGDRGRAKFIGGGGPGGRQPRHRRMYDDKERDRDIDNSAGYQFAAQEIINAVKDDDSEKLARSLKSFVSMCYDEKTLKG